MIPLVVAILLGALASPAADGADRGAVPAPGAPESSTQAPLLGPGHLKYLGAFRVPGGPIGASTFAYGGTSLAYDAAKTSLLVVGHAHHQMVAEIGIPAVVNSARLDELATAPVRQPFADVTRGKLGTIGPGTVRVGGLLPHRGQLIVTGYVYYDANGAQTLSHLVTAANFAGTEAPRGFYAVGKLGAGFVSGYMATVPPAWQRALGGPALTGQCCLSIISRTSFGPAVFAFDPDDLGAKSPVPTSPLVYYPQRAPLGPWDGASPHFNTTTEITGMILPAATRSLLFFGRHGRGPYDYGCGTGDEPLPPPRPDCPKWIHDPEESAKGPHAYPYDYQVWAYDVLDLAAVKAGQRQPWEVKPYRVWTLKLPFPAKKTHLGGVAYDPQSDRVYLAQLYADVVGFDPLPVIHVFQVVRDPAAKD